MVQNSEFERLMAEVAAGSEDAVWKLAETYTPYIIRAVRHSLSRRLRQKLDSQDFAQTLWKSLLLRPADLMRLKTPEQLIAYLAKASKYKVFEKARRFSTQKCDVGREKSLEQLSATPGFAETCEGKSLHSGDPSPSSIVAVREHWNSVLANASERDQEIVRLRRAGYTFEAISLKLNIYEQTARRAIHRILAQFAS